MTKKHIITLVVIAIVFASGGFFGGYKYGQNKNSAGKRVLDQFPNMNGRQFGQNSNNNSTTQKNRLGGGGMIMGTILSIDGKTLTVKVQDGGSKIVFLNDSTAIEKSVSGSLADLTTDKTVQIAGTTNSDGSITAQNIQIRSETQNPSGQNNSAPPPQGQNKN
jgi:hypothetical protein